MLQAGGVASELGRKRLARLQAELLALALAPSLSLSISPTPTLTLTLTLTLALTLQAELLALRHASAPPGTAAAVLPHPAHQSPHHQSPHRPPPVAPPLSPSMGAMGAMAYPPYTAAALSPQPQPTPPASSLLRGHAAHTPGHTPGRTPGHTPGHTPSHTPGAYSAAPLPVAAALAAAAPSPLAAAPAASMPLEPRTPGGSTYSAARPSRYPDPAAATTALPSYHPSPSRPAPPSLTWGQPEAAEGGVYAEGGITAGSITAVLHEARTPAGRRLAAAAAGGGGGPEAHALREELALVREEHEASQAVLQALRHQLAEQAAALALTRP